ncbi:MAG: class I SAM-dependent methyltransferase [Bacillota bacterium]
MSSEKRATFTEVAELYDRARNQYPDQLFDDLFRLTQMPSGANVLEIGPGTGFATLQVAKRGCSVVGVELGTEMAAVARRKLAAYPKVEIQVAAFEEWQPSVEPFDLVMAATSFHWLDPEVRYTKAASVLRQGGYLAIINYRHVAGDDLSFYYQVQACYERYMHSTLANFHVPEVGELVPDTSELETCGLFEPPIIRTYITDETYNTEQYIDLLSTYSDHIRLTLEDRSQLFDCIRGLINGQCGGRVTKRYLHEMIMARKK